MSKSSTAAEAGDRQAFPAGDNDGPGLTVRQYGIIQVLASLSAVAFRPDKVVTLVDPADVVETAVALVDLALEEFE